MSSDFWFLDQAGNQRGPVAREEIVRLIGEGAITRDTLIWTSSMSDWRAASQVEGFASFFSSPTPPPLQLQSGAPSRPPEASMRPALPVWSLFGRLLLVMIGDLLIIPSPWTRTSFYRWLCEHIALPNGMRLKFAGKPGDIWYIFIAMSVLNLIEVSVLKEFRFAILLAAPLTWFLGLQVLRWICANVGSEDGRVNLSFEGGYWKYIGWHLLLLVSIVTIIGWAWVIKFMMQWILKNVRGTTRFEFAATGLAILWRTFVATLASVFIIPIPWVLRWYMSWLISQVSVVAN